MENAFNIFLMVVEEDNDKEDAIQKIVISF